MSSVMSAIKPPCCLPQPAAAQAQFLCQDCTWAVDAAPTSSCSYARNRCCFAWCNDEGITAVPSADADCDADPRQVLWRGEAAARGEGALRKGGAPQGANSLALSPPFCPSLCGQKGKGKEKGKESPRLSRPMVRGGAPAGAMCGKLKRLALQLKQQRQSCARRKGLRSCCRHPVAAVGHAP